jgi:hypothetical protein
MGNVEILGRPKYRPIKVRLGDQLNPLEQLKSKQSSIPLLYADLVYERDVTEENQTSHQDMRLSF